MQDSVVRITAEERTRAKAVLNFITNTNVEKRKITSVVPAEDYF